MYLSLIFLPLLGCVVSGFFGRKVGVTGAQQITSACVIITTILAVLAFIETGFNNIPVSISLFRWVDSEWYSVDWGMEFDSLTVSMLIPVLIISSLVHIYSISYMSSDPHNQRFFSYLSLFTFMMIILVTANNYLLMFVGWEGVGVCSYLLVGFWFTRIAANQSSMSAFLTNRVGDCLLTIGMFAILWSLGNLDYATVFSIAPYMNENIITMIGICLLIGAMAKSSQLGLHVWLPMAMEGPTPVSALIHAATMVTAGVYLLIRSSPLLEYSSTLLLLCLWLGALTTVFSSLVGLFQQDIKKVIAYSTMSQLGMMVIAVGLSSYNIALFHLVNHAFYKGLLFLGAGSIIHAVGDHQDFRKYGGLIRFLPLTYSIMVIASLSLVAFPFMAGFYSKDLILESAYGQFTFSAISVYYIAVIGAIFTTLYSVKVLGLTFWAKPSGSKNFYKLESITSESNIYMILPLIILAIFSIFFGFITRDIFVGLGSGFFTDNSIFIHPIHEIMISTEFGVPEFFKLLPFIFTVSFIILTVIISEYFSENILNFKLSKLGYNIFGFFNQRFLIEFFYNKYITSLILELGGQTIRKLDKGSIEWLGPVGNYYELIKLSKAIVSLNTAVVTNYGLYIVISFVIYLIILYSKLFSLILLLSAPVLLLWFLFTKFLNNSDMLEYRTIEARIPLFDSLFVLLAIFFSFLSPGAFQFMESFEHYEFDKESCTKDFSQLELLNNYAYPSNPKDDDWESEPESPEGSGPLAAGSEHDSEVESTNPQREAIIEKRNINPQEDTNPFEENTNSQIEDVNPQEVATKDTVSQSEQVQEEDQGESSEHKDSFLIKKMRAITEEIKKDVAEKNGDELDETIEKYRNLDRFASEIADREDEMEEEEAIRLVEESKKELQKVDKLKDQEDSGYDNQYRSNVNEHGKRSRED